MAECSNVTAFLTGRCTCQCHNFTQTPYNIAQRLHVPTVTAPMAFNICTIHSLKTCPDVRKIYQISSHYFYNNRKL